MPLHGPLNVVFSVAFRSDRKWPRPGQAVAGSVLHPFNRGFHESEPAISSVSIYLLFIQCLPLDSFWRKWPVIDANHPFVVAMRPSNSSAKYSTNFSSVHESYGTPSSTRTCAGESRRAMREVGQAGVERSTCAKHQQIVPVRQVAPTN